MTNQMLRLALSKKVDSLLLAGEMQNQFTDTKVYNSLHGDMTHRKRGNLVPVTPAEITVNTNSSLGTVLSSGSSIDFNVYEKSPYAINDVILDLTIASASGATLSPTPFVINRVEILSSSGVRLQIIDGYDCWFQLLHKDIDDRQSQIAVINTDSSYGAGTAISTSAQYFLSIPCFLSQTHQRFYLLNGTNGHFVIRVYFNTAATFTEVGTADSVLSAAILRFRCDEVNQKLVETEMAELKKNQYIDYPFLTSIIVSQTQTVANSTTYDFELSGMHSISPYFLLFATASPRTGTAFRTFSDIFASFALLSSSGTTLMGKPNENSTYNRRITCSDLFRGNMSNLLALHAWGSFGSVAEQRVSDVLGILTYSGKERLSFTSNTNAGGSSYQISVLFRRYALLRLHSNGLLEVINGN